MVSLAAPTDTDRVTDLPWKESQILSGAAAVFARDGYGGASMSRIALEAGVSKGTLYNYFDSKAELFSAYMHRNCTRWIDRAFDDLGATVPPDEMLRRIGRCMFAMLMTGAALETYRMVVAEAEKFPSLAQSFYDEGPARALEQLSNYLCQTASEGRLAVQDADFAAEQFFALVQTQLLMKRRLHLIGMPSDAQIEQVVDGAVRLFMKGHSV